MMLRHPYRMAQYRICWLSAILEQSRSVFAVIIILMRSLKVERYIEEDQKKIRENQKKAVLAAGGEWVDPAERLKREQEEAGEKKNGKSKK